MHFWNFVSLRISNKKLHLLQLSKIFLNMSNNHIIWIVTLHRERSLLHKDLKVTKILRICIEKFCEFWPLYFFRRMWLTSQTATIAKIFTRRYRESWRPLFKTRNRAVADIILKTILYFLRLEKSRICIFHCLSNLGKGKCTTELMGKIALKLSKNLKK